VRHVFSLIADEMHGENLQSASALYVPLLQYPMKTAAKQPTSQRSSTGGKRGLRLQENAHKDRLRLIYPYRLDLNTKMRLVVRL
jgi:hypothetical protein